VAAEDAPFPDASLHFLPLNPNTTYGVFRRNDIPDSTGSVKDYIVWSLDDTPDALAKFLQDTWIPATGRAGNEQALRDHGDALYETLFPYRVDMALKARKKFEEFIGEQVSRQVQTSAERLPSIFIRVVKHSPGPPLIIPLGLMVVEVAKGRKDFLGFHFRIEVPLEVQTYKVEQNCLSRWVTVLPPKSIRGDLTKALDRMGHTYKEWQDQSSARSFDSMAEFRSWINDRNVEEPSTALTVLSHHDRDTLFYTPQDKVLSKHIQRRFNAPSIAILNGCGTGGLGGADLVRYFNNAGIQTVIATSTDVNTEMAGDLFSCLSDNLKKNAANNEYFLSQAYFDTMQCLRSKRPSGPVAEEYGARVLRYTLLGNANVRLCLPKRSNP
jgi:hypothetical protein